MPACRVVVADDHGVVRVGLRAMLDTQPDIRVVGEAANGSEALALVDEQRPDVLILDLTMPETDCTKCIEAVRSLSPATGILVHTMHDDPLYVRATLAAGARGYVTKDCAPEELLRGIREVRRGATFVANARGIGAPSDPRSPTANALRRLSTREAQVLRLLATGHTYREIATKMNVSLSSVGTFRSRIAVKLGLETRADLVRAALAMGLVGDG